MITKKAGLYFLLFLFCLSTKLSYAYSAKPCTLTTSNGEGIDQISISAINDSGQTVGTFVGFDGASHLFIYDGDELKQVDYPSYSKTTFVDINASGIAIGNYSRGGESDIDGPTGSSRSYGFIYDGSSFRMIDYPGSFGTTISHINDSGIVVGIYKTETDQEGYYLKHAFTYDGSTYTTIDYPGALWTDAKDINNSGVVTGVYYNEEENKENFVYNGQGFTYDGNTSTFTQIAYPGASSTRPQSINNSGEIVGLCTIKNPSNVILGVNSFIYDNGTFRKIDFPNAKNTYASDINDSGKIVGNYDIGDAEGSSELGGFVYDGSSFFKIAYGINTQFVSTNTKTIGINNSGKIIGSYQEGNRRRVFTTFLASGPNFFTDEDKDGYTVEGDFCGNIDCDDTDSKINPNNKWYYDSDGDGYGSYDRRPITQCSKPDGYVSNDTDDDDTDFNVKSSSVPTLSEWGIILLSIAVIGGFYKRRKISIIS